MKTKIIFFLTFFIIFSTVSNAQSSIVTYEKIKLTGVGSISIPSIMELQSGVYKDLSNSFSKEFGLDVSGAIIFQQKGLNSLTKTSTYARVIIQESKGSNGEFKTLSNKLSLTAKELKYLDSAMKEELETQLSSQGVEFKLIKWFGGSLESLSGYRVIRTSYIRQLEKNPPVYVEAYYIENYDRSYNFTLSYRFEDASIWADVMKTIKDSFIITNIRMPQKRNRKS